MDVCDSPVAARVSSQWAATTSSGMLYITPNKRSYEQIEQLQQFKRRKVGNHCMLAKAHARKAASSVVSSLHFDARPVSVDSMDIDVANRSWKGRSLSSSSHLKKGSSVEYGCVVHRSHCGLESLHPTYRPLRHGYVDEVDLKLEQLLTSYKLQKQLMSRQRFRPTEAAIAEDEDVMMLHGSWASHPANTFANFLTPI